MIPTLSTDLNLHVRVEANLTSKFTQRVDNVVDNSGWAAIIAAYEA